MWAALTVDLDYDYVKSVDCVFAHEDKEQVENFIKTKKDECDKSFKEYNKYLEDYEEYLKNLNQETINKIMNRIGLVSVTIRSFINQIDKYYKEKLKDLIKEFNPPEVIYREQFYLTEIK